ACEAIAATYHGRMVGSYGKAAVFAFYPNKQMTTGEGGVIVTDDDDWNEIFRSLRNQGRDTSGAWLNHIRLGYNYRLDEMSAALGLAQVRRLTELLEGRQRVADGYARRLAGVKEVILPYVDPDVTISWFVYVIRLAPSIDRDRVMADLAARGVQSRP